MSASDAISIAVLTSNEDDVALINSALRDVGIATRCNWVKAPGDLAISLSKHPAELIALNLDTYPDPIRTVIKQKDRFNPETPVIGLKTEADEVAIEKAMEHGAKDLVSLSLVSRLQAVVKRELRALRVERALNSTLTSATEYKRQIKEYLQTSNSPIALVQDGIIVEANAEWLRLFRAANSEEVVGMPVMDSFHSESHAAVKGALVATVQGKWVAGEKLKVKPEHDLGDLQDFNIELSRVEYDGASTVQVRVPAEEVHSKEPTKLVHDALKRDPTTLFYHRAQFIERLKKRLGRKPSSGLHLLAYIKPDKFSAVQKKVGVLESEEVLAQLSEMIRRRLHPRDVAGRFEGTGIMVLLERGKERDGQLWGQQLVDFVKSQTFEVGDVSTQMTLSVGVCAVSKRFDSFEEFVSTTVETCLQARADGGDTAMLNEADEQDTKQKELDGVWAKHLKAALMDDRFQLAQLPIAGLRSDSIEMYDLLVRMIDEQGNSVLPSEFIPAAERTNTIKSIDRWMIKASMDFCVKNDADRVFVRLSKKSVVDVSTADWIKATCDEEGFDASRLVVQIPERDAAMHIRQVQNLAKSLKNVGVGLALEHFGVADGKFQILDILKPDYIKIEGELMHTIMTDNDVQTQVESIVEAADKRSIRTIAERVENANAMAVLFQLGLDFMQGHYVHEAEVVLSDDTANTKQQTLAQLIAAG